MSWELFLVKGDKDVIRGFVHGFAAGAGATQAVYCEAELPLERESLARMLLSGPHHRVLVQARLAEKLAAALESTACELELRLESRKPVGKLRFVAKAETASPEVAASLEEKLLHPPAGVAVEHKQEETQTDRTARGTELYAPVHHFQYRAEVHYAGEVEGILALHRVLAATDFVDVSPVEVA